MRLTCSHRRLTPLAVGVTLPSARYGQIEIDNDGGEFVSTLDQSWCGANRHFAKCAIVEGDVTLAIEPRGIDHTVRTIRMAEEGLRPNPRQGLIHSACHVCRRAEPKTSIAGQIDNVECFHEFDVRANVGIQLAHGEEKRLHRPDRTVAQHRLGEGDLGLTSRFVR